MFRVLYAGSSGLKVNVFRVNGPLIVFGNLIPFNRPLAHYISS